MKDGGPAFPLGSGDERDPVGMSLRDYFAAKAMAAFIATPEAMSILSSEGDTEQNVANASYRQADDMIKAKEKDNGTQ